MIRPCVLRAYPANCFIPVDCPAGRDRSEARQFEFEVAGACQRLPPFYPAKLRHTSPVQEPGEMTALLPVFKRRARSLRYLQLWIAGFIEATGTSARNMDFFIHVETNTPPDCQRTAPPALQQYYSHGPASANQILLFRSSTAAQAAGMQSQRRSPSLSARRMSRAASRDLIDSRLSCCFLPRHSPRLTLIQRPARCMSSGINASPAA